MRILFLSPRQCWPAQSGAKLREYHFLRSLAKRAEVTYLYFYLPETPQITKEDLPFCHKVVGVPKPASYGRIKILQGALGRLPLSVLNYTSAEMYAEVKRLISATAYDLVHLDSIHMIGYAAALDGSARTVYNWHNIESEAMRRYSTTVDSRLRRKYARLTADKLGRLEHDILRNAFGHIVCSERERNQLLQIAPNARIATIPNGVDVSFFAGAGDSTLRRDVIFVGTMDYFPNAESIILFSRRVWPTIKERLPHVRLVIVGANPGPDVVALGQLPDVTVTGTVPDVRPYYREALAAIVPLRTGGGTRLKILEAMAAGVPVISTEFGAEGLDLIPDRHFLLADADDAASWASHLSCLADPLLQSRQKIGAAGLDLVRAHFDWEALGQTLWTTYEGWMRGAV